MNSLVSSTPFRKPQTPTPHPTSTPCWTPGPGYSTQLRSSEVVPSYNSAMDTIASLVNPPVTRSHLDSQLGASLNNVSKKERLRIVEKARDDCLLVCNVIAPNDGEELFHSMTSLDDPNDVVIPDDLVVLMTAYKNAGTRNLKRQILSLYAYRYPVKALQKIHESYEILSTWQIKQARLHARSSGPGTLPANEKRHRVRLDMAKVDHFVEFVNRPHFYQDVSYGSKILTLDSGKKIEMPNVVRTVTRATMVSQYLEYCKEQEYDPLSRTTLFKILEVREASQRKSLQGLDNTAADGASAFQMLETIVDALEKGGMDKHWCSDVGRRLRDSKKYLKTDYRVHCKASESTCADHCRKYALSDEKDASFRQRCTHQHSTICEDCQSLKTTINDIEHALKGTLWTPYSDEQQQDLLYDFGCAQTDIFLWKSHILRSINQDQAKQDLLKQNDHNTALLVMDWAMKFQQIKYREKQSDWFGKRGISWHVSTVITVNKDTGDLDIQTYAHLLDTGNGSMQSHSWIA